MFTAKKMQSFGHELKFVFGSAFAHDVQAFLDRHYRPDPVHPVGIVSSIYFDTPDLAYVQEKINSDYLKTKVRARWYRDPNGGFGEDRVFAEAKFRIGTRRDKIRRITKVRSSWIERQKLTRSSLQDIPRQLSSEGVVMHQPLLPLLLVSYHRRRYIDPCSETRISLDTEISLVRGNPLFALHWKEKSLRQAVVEVKGATRKLPAALRLLPHLSCHRGSFSKFANCFEASVGAHC
jgi:hypothetical protein